MGENAAMKCWWDIVVTSPQTNKIKNQRIEIKGVSRTPLRIR